MNINTNMSKESSLPEDAAAAVALETLKSKKVSIRSTWTPDEDKIIKRSLEKVKHSEDMPGEEFTCWAGLTSQLPGRTGRQIRDRWNNYLNPKIIHEPFTRDDDIKLWNAGRELGKKWVEISTTVFKSTRSENQLKNRWNSAAFKRFAAHEYGDVGRAMFNVDITARVHAYKRRERDHLAREEGEICGGVIVLPPPKKIKYKKRVHKPLKNSVPMAIHDPGAARISREKAAMDAATGLISLPMRPGAIPMGKTWGQAEDTIVLNIVGKESNFSNWAALASSRLPGRTGKQIRDRWNNYLNPSINHSAWTADEDLRLWHAHDEFGKKWTAIGTEKFHTTRSENQVKNRFYSAGFKKFVAEKFGKGAYEKAKADNLKRIQMNCVAPPIGVKSTAPAAPLCGNHDEMEKIGSILSTMTAKKVKKKMLPVIVSTPATKMAAAKVTPGNDEEPTQDGLLKAP